MQSFRSMSPARAAAVLALDADASWAKEFLRRFEREIGGNELDRVMTVWDLSGETVSRIFGVSRQAVQKWRTEYVPSERAVAVADLAAATEILLRYVRRDRIPAVVRRSAPILGGRSLLDLAEAGETAQVRRQTAAMFDLRRIAP